jgi:uncharacterized peroxidase-related enzyme
MSRILLPSIENATGATAEVYAQLKKAIGSVPNTFALIGAHGPAALKSILQAEGVLASGSLSKQDQETIKLVVSELMGCDYCTAAHMMLGKMAGLKAEVMKNLRTGEPTGDSKRDALARFVRTLIRNSGTISDEKFAEIKTAGYAEAQLVEISLAIALITFTNVFNRIADTPLDFPGIA